MTARHFVAGVGFVLALLLAVWLVARKGRSSLQPPTVTVLGYTDGSVDYTKGLAKCVISNQCNQTLKIWSVVYAETPPFKAANGPKQWTIIEVYQGSYLKPGEVKDMTFRQPDITGQWRLMIPWSQGYRAEIRDRFRQYKFLPAFFRVAPEFYASSDVITETRRASTWTTP